MYCSQQLPFPFSYSIYIFILISQLGIRWHAQDEFKLYGKHLYSKAAKLINVTGEQFQNFSIKISRKHNSREHVTSTLSFWLPYPRRTLKRDILFVSFD